MYINVQSFEHYKKQLTFCGTLYTSLRHTCVPRHPGWESMMCKLTRKTEAMRGAVSKLLVSVSLEFWGRFYQHFTLSFMWADPKSGKRYWRLDWISTLLGSAFVKALLKMLIKLSPERPAPGSRWHTRTLGQPVSVNWSLQFRTVKRTRLPPSWLVWTWYTPILPSYFRKIKKFNFRFKKITFFFFFTFYL